MQCMRRFRATSPALPRQDPRCLPFRAPRHLRCCADVSALHVALWQRKQEFVHTRRREERDFGAHGTFSAWWGQKGSEHRFRVSRPYDSVNYDK
jgi:hypothetical protein